MAKFTYRLCYVSPYIWYICYPLNISKWLQDFIYVSKHYRIWKAKESNTINVEAYSSKLHRKNTLACRKHLLINSSWRHELPILIPLCWLTTFNFSWILQLRWILWLSLIHRKFKWFIECNYEITVEETMWIMLF